MRCGWLRLLGVVVCGLCAVCVLLFGLARQRPVAADTQVGAVDGLLISAVHVGLPGWGGQDEAFQIANPSALPILLTESLQAANQAVIQQPLQPEQGYFRVSDAPGLGIDLNSEFMAPHLCQVVSA